MNPRLTFLAVITFAAAVLRLLPHPPNFEPIGALALLGGAHAEKRHWAFILPLAAMLLSDALIGFHDQMLVVYGSYALIAWTGFALRQRKGALPVAGGAIAASILFFTLTNFGVWAFGPLYPKTPEGLVACYIAAIPFLGNTVAGNLFYSAVLFGGFALLERKVAALAPAAR